MRQLIATRARRGWTYARIAAALAQRAHRREVGDARRHAALDGLSCPQPSAAPDGPGARARHRRAAAPARLTAWQISTALRQPRSTVTRVLARAGLNRIALLDPAAPIQRYEWPHVGDLLHVESTRLGRVVGIGHRIHGDRRCRARRAGYEYPHVVIDDATDVCRGAGGR
ncbi:MAG: hypothetical protein R2712_31060 [Vicinamibacterales bacterium]